MLSRLVPFWFILMLGPTAALADAGQDCARLNGSSDCGLRPGDSTKFRGQWGLLQPRPRLLGQGRSRPGVCGLQQGQGALD
jgi:hypothetical protein